MTLKSKGSIPLCYEFFMVSGFVFRGFIGQSLGLQGFGFRVLLSVFLGSF